MARMNQRTEPGPLASRFCCKERGEQLVAQLWLNELFEDVTCGLGPHEGLWIAVVLIQVAVDGGL